MSIISNETLNKHVAMFKKLSIVNLFWQRSMAQIKGSLKRLELQAKMLMHITDNLVLTLSRNFDKIYVC